MPGIEAPPPAEGEPPPELPPELLEEEPPEEPPEDPDEPPLEPDEPPLEPDGTDDEGIELDEDCCWLAQPPMRKAETELIATQWAAIVSDR